MPYDEPPYELSRSTLRKRYGSRAIKSNGPTGDYQRPGSQAGGTPRPVWDAFFHGPKAGASRMTTRYLQPRGNPAVQPIRPATDGWIAPTMDDVNSIQQRYGGPAASTASGVGRVQAQNAGGFIASARARANAPSAASSVDLTAGAPLDAGEVPDYLSMTMNNLGMDASGQPSAAPNPTASKLGRLRGPSPWDISLDDEDPFRLTL